jgi:hypothetical protein
MSLLTIGADREYEKAAVDPWTSPKNLNKSNIVFAVCIGFAFFSATLTVGLLLVWFGVECCFTIHRRGVLRRAMAQLLHTDNREENDRV